MPEGGVLGFALSRVEIQGHDPPPVQDMAPGEWIRLSVSDTGIGMTADVRSQLFEPFFTTKAVGEGTGLGLAQVFGIVQQHHGHIDVETAPGAGSAFHLYFPASEDGEGPVVREPETSSDRPDGRGETILLVEDEDPLREAGRSVLESLGYRVKTAANGREALALCQLPRWSSSAAQQIDVVITDLVMPEMGGEALLRELRGFRSDLPVIAITGYALGGDDLSALKDAGFATLIAKPIDVDAWARAIRRALDAGGSPP
jgi:CheY-like chemotaxis protein